MGVWDLTSHKVLDFRVSVKGSHEEGSGMGVCMILQGHSACCCEWVVRGKNGIRESREKVWQ